MKITGATIEVREVEAGDPDHIDLHAYQGDKHLGVLEIALTTPMGTPSAGHALLLFVYVHRRYRRRGIAARLTEELRTRHGQRRIIYGDATESGQAFAESIGAERWGYDNEDHRDGHYGLCPMGCES